MFQALLESRILWRDFQAILVRFDGLQLQRELSEERQDATFHNQQKAFQQGPWRTNGDLAPNPRD
jgi:hypothetical protein